MLTCGRKEPPPSAHAFNRSWDIAAHCVQPGNTSCRIRWINNTAKPPQDLVCCSVGIAHLQWDLVTNIPPRLYWGDASYLRRYGN